jgi:hypothetical protein
MKNLGRIWIHNSNTPWRMDKDESRVTGNEFLSETRQCDAFLEGFCRGRAIDAAFAYVHGDFFNERTHVVLVCSSVFPSESFSKAVQEWINVPRRKNWRVLVNSERMSKKQWLVYDTMILTNDTSMNPSYRATL